MSKGTRSILVSFLALALLLVTLLVNASISLSLNQATQQAPTTVNKQIPATTAREITGCTVIDSPGVYVLTQDITGTYPGKNWCIWINTSNVILDGQGHSITGLGAYSTTGIFVGSASNVTIRNTKISGYWAGIVFNGPGSGNTIINNTVVKNSCHGIQFFGTSGNIIANNVIADNGVTYQCPGIYFYATYNNIVYNNVFNNTRNAIANGGSNQWNTTLSPGVNIVGGNWIGGNYWAQPDGKGYSQTCRDIEEPIGICDQPYVINDANTDYYLLAEPV